MGIAWSTYIAYRNTKVYYSVEGIAEIEGEACQHQYNAAEPATVDDGEWEMAEEAEQEEAQGVPLRPKRTLRPSTRTSGPELVK